MCGIVGIIGKDSSEYIQNMTSAVHHRGPNDEGIYISGNLALGHKRLSIQDLSKNAHQPMISKDKRYVIVFNGEIYNHLELRDILKGKYEFISTSDTETLLYGFIEYGTDILNKLNGIFAFAIYDTLKNDIIIARDQFGVKPLYYSLINEVFLFGSEIKSLLQYPKFDKTINKKAIANYLYFLWSPGAETPFENCNKLLPGHFIKLSINDPKHFKINKYYEVPFTGNRVTNNEVKLIDELELRLTEAVKRQLISDVPIGFFLSGGLDSSLIVAIAKKINPHVKLKCFTIKTTLNSKREGFINDLPYAQKTAKYLEADLEIVNGDINIIEDFDSMIYHLDEPQADAAPLNVSNIAKRARELGYFVLLGGTAGDDIFSGYRRHQLLNIDKKLKILPFHFKKLLASQLTSFLPLSNNFNRRIKKLFSIYNFDSLEEGLASLYGWLEVNEVIKLFKDRIEFQPTRYLLESLENIPKERESLNKMLYWDIKYFLTDHNLNYTDKLSMAHGVEVRVPYLDKDLVEFSASLPVNMKLRGNTTKYLLRKVAEHYLPLEIIYRPKTGFGAPVRDWIINDLNDKINNELLNNNNALFAEIFNLDAVSSLVERNKLGQIDASYSIFALLAINSWFNQFTECLK